MERDWFAERIIQVRPEPSLRAPCGGGNAAQDERGVAVAVAGPRSRQYGHAGTPGPLRVIARRLVGGDKDDKDQRSEG